MSKGWFYRLLIISILGLFSLGSLAVNPHSITDPGEQWLSHGRDYTEQRFSPLDNINANNIDQLDLAWSFKFDTARGMEATPLVHNGVIYISTGLSLIHI